MPFALLIFLVGAEFEAFWLHAVKCPL
ncbi:hypothetical protein THIOSC15_410016 [uncultured Thiomicrorhabdus sp.]